MLLKQQSSILQRASKSPTERSPDATSVHANIREERPARQNPRRLRFVPQQAVAGKCARRVAHDSISSIGAIQIPKRAEERPNHRNSSGSLANAQRNSRSPKPICPAAGGRTKEAPGRRGRLSWNPKDSSRRQDQPTKGCPAD